MLILNIKWGWGQQYTHLNMQPDSNFYINVSLCVCGWVGFDNDNWDHIINHHIFNFN